MSLLATLRAKKQIRAVATATPATVATHQVHEAPTVASVATVAVASLPNQKIEVRETAPNHAPVVTLAALEKPQTAVLSSADPDRWCWPHSEAMNGWEIDTFTARLARFSDKGLFLADAEHKADRLVIRDREGDDRRLCLECAHLQGTGRLRCGNWSQANWATTQQDSTLSKTMVVTLQRCGGFGGLVS